MKRHGRPTSSYRKHSGTLAAQAGLTGGRQDQVTLMWTANSWSTEINMVKKLKCSLGRCPWPGDRQYSESEGSRIMIGTGGLGAEFSPQGKWYGRPHQAGCNPGWSYPPGRCLLGWAGKLSWKPRFVSGLARFCEHRMPRAHSSAPDTWWQQLG